MNDQVTPTKQGQICKLVKPFHDENSAETYLILEDISEYADNAIIYVVSITDLQRNIANPTLAPRKAVRNRDRRNFFVTARSSALECASLIWPFYFSISSWTSITPIPCKAISNYCCNYASIRINFTNTIISVVYNVYITF